MIEKGMKSNFSLRKTIATQLIDNYAKENKLESAVELDRKINNLTAMQFYNDWKKLFSFDASLY